MAGETKMVTVKRSSGRGYLTSAVLFAVVTGTCLLMITLLSGPYSANPIAPYLFFGAVVSAPLALICLITGSIIRAMWFMRGDDEKSIPDLVG